MFKKLLLVFIIMSLFSLCGPVVLIPPEIDLIPFERIGLISFSLENAAGRIDEIATQRFLQEITFHQRGAQIIELGTLEDVLARIDKSTIDQEAALAIGKEYGVTAFFFGKISVSEVRPQIDISTLISSMRVQAVFSMSATARFLSTETGVTLWTDSVLEKDSLAYLSMEHGQIPYFDVRDQEETYRELIERLIYALTRDFRPTKRRL
ncbi:MAG: hypothetical protein JSV17_15145 [Candidatus Aminicenantes bacterium]|nr:MAG: hypothetical protein JSV17_15145 [Candidatus Aminicenantes bacterium]